LFQRATLSAVEEHTADEVEAYKAQSRPQ